MNSIQNSSLSLLEHVTAEEYQTQTTYSRTLTELHVPSDVTTDDAMSAVEASGTLDFWNEPEEDIYDESDGNVI